MLSVRRNTCSRCCAWSVTSSTAAEIQSALTEVAASRRSDGLIACSGAMETVNAEASGTLRVEVPRIQSVGQ
jgi:hypothetical protein